MRRLSRCLPLLALLGCAESPSAPTAGPLAVQVEHDAGILTITNTGQQLATVVAIDRQLLSLVSLPTCESWTSVSAGARISMPIAAGATEMLVMYCLFASPALPRPSGGASITVSVR